MIDQLVRSARKTVSLTVTKDLKVVVRAPMRMPRRDIERFVQEHQDWIAQQKQRLLPRYQQAMAFAYAEGQLFPYLGELHPIRFHPGKEAELRDACLWLPEENALRPGALERLFRREAHALAMRWVELYAPAMQVQPEKVSITAAKTRWGSCSGKNRLCFSWRIACLPMPQIEYIVVHELAHIREHNHSQRFWAVVASVLPDWQQRRYAIRQFQEQIPL